MLTSLHQRSLKLAALSRAVCRHFVSCMLINQTHLSLHMRPTLQNHMTVHPTTPTAQTPATMSTYKPPQPTPRPLSLSTTTHTHSSLTPSNTTIDPTPSHLQRLQPTSPTRPHTLHTLHNTPIHCLRLTGPLVNRSRITLMMSPSRGSARGAMDPRSSPGVPRSASPSGHLDIRGSFVTCRRRGQGRIDS